jgi:hypothetical protein
MGLKLRKQFLGLLSVMWATITDQSLVASLPSINGITFISMLRNEDKRQQEHQYFHEDRFAFHDRNLF